MMIDRYIQVRVSKVLVPITTFDENCVDIRNSRVIEFVTKLADYIAEVMVGSFITLILSSLKGTMAQFGKQDIVGKAQRDNSRSGS